MLYRCFILAVVMFILLFAGCSSHPPSAAQFMNVKMKEGEFNNSFIVGGSARAGNIYKEHVDGETIHWDSYTCAESYGNFDLSLLFRYNHFILGFSMENLSYRGVVGFVSQYIGLQGWVGGVDSFFPDDNPFLGGLMLIEEYPIHENLKIGLSEHISRNAYHIHYDLKDISSILYNEFGIGTYLTYKNFSFEFRYGREIGEPRNRFYFMMHYAVFN